MSVLAWGVMLLNAPSAMSVRQAMYNSVRHSSVMYSASNPNDKNDTSANVFVLQFNSFMSFTITLMISTDINITETTYSC